MIFSQQSTLITDITEAINLSGWNKYCNEVVFLQPYELPACLIYGTNNTPSEPRLRDTVGKHERALEIRFELRADHSEPQDYAAVADSIYNQLVEYKATHPQVLYVGNPSLKIGLVESQPTEIAASLDVIIYYLGRFTPTATS